MGMSFDSEIFSGKTAFTREWPVKVCERWPGLASLLCKPVSNQHFVSACDQSKEHAELFRFVDRDMVMRYHWGLAVGHVYTHGCRSGSGTSSIESRPELEDVNEDAEDLEEYGDPGVSSSLSLGDGQGPGGGLKDQCGSEAPLDSESDASEMYSEDDVDDLGSESELSDFDEDEAELYDMFQGNTSGDMEFTSYD
jgi:hypothetical protein